MKSELYTVKEVAKLLRCNVDRVYGLINAGLPPAIKLGQIKVPSDDLAQFIETHKGQDVSDPYRVVPL